MNPYLSAEEADDNQYSGLLDLPENELFFLGFQRWKRPFARLFFKGKHLRFVKAPDQLPCGCTVLIWGMRFANDRFPDFVRVIRVEDGFIRSVGLGADLVRPMSWVLDDLGIYYDATRASRLEVILADTNFSKSLIDRASKLRNSLVTSGVTKYNVGNQHWRRPETDQRVILVPGQVETDSSIYFGAPKPLCSIQRNIDLLQAVRNACPHAYIVYKPHPDVLAGLRLEGDGEGGAKKWCDEIVTDAPIGEVLDLVDEVHVLTSLAGFEALVRGKYVTCYGQPFYSGWGLTNDVVSVSRRVRKLTLDELIAGVLLVYPMYVSSCSGRFLSAEECLEELIEQRRQQTLRLPIWRRLLRLVLQKSKW